MNIENTQTVWAKQNDLLNKAVNIDTSLLNKVQTKEAKSIMTNVIFARLIEAMMFLIVVCALWLYISNNLELSAPVISAAILNVFAIIGLAGSIGQIALVMQINYSLPVKQVQQQILKIKSHGLAVAKLIMLSIPLYMAYVFLGFELLANVDLYQLMPTETIWLFAVISAALYVPVFYVIKVTGQQSKQPKWAEKLCHFIAGDEWLQMNAIIHSFKQEHAGVN